MSYSPSKFSAVKFHLEYVPFLLKQYSQLYNWTNKIEWKMLDIGTGPGQLITKVKDIIPKNCTEIICIDNQLEMVDYVNSLKIDNRIFCRQMDIETEKLPDDLKERFDFAFSSNCFMFVDKFRQLFKNVNQTLKPNGELFFIWCKKSHIHEAYKALSHTEKWWPYTKEFSNWNSYFDNENATDLLEMETKIANLDILKIEELKDLFIEYDEKKQFIHIFDSLDYVSKRIPKCDLAKYKEDYYKQVVPYIIDETLKVKLHFPSLVLAARKIKSKC